MQFIDSPAEPAECKKSGARRVSADIMKNFRCHYMKK